MKKKKAKEKKSRPLPKKNQQIPNSMIRPLTVVGMNAALQNARDYPLYGCWLMQGWEEEGMTPVVVAREQEAGRIMFGVYLVDLYCLGIKDAYTRADYSKNRFERELPAMCAEAPQSCSPELAHEVIYGAMEYAASLGFEPHPDFKKQMADLMLDPPEAHPRNNHVTFGKDGKPLFISGPNDSESKIKSVISTLTRTRGEGNFNFLFGLGEFEE